MTLNLRLLIWSALLISAAYFILEWEDEASNLQPEILKLQKIKAREANDLLNVDWESSLIKVQHAKIDWLNRLEVIDNPGIFKADTLESLAKLCDKSRVQCRLSAQGEPMPLNKESVSKNNISGIYYSTTKITIPSASPSLEDFLKIIENGEYLRKIEKFTLRSDMIDIIVRSYGINSTILQKEKNSLQSN